ncbi:MAG: hypothetical protein ABIJ05_01700 [Patescibacteria group bacterium]
MSEKNKPEEDKFDENNPDVTWEIARGRGVNISNLSMSKISDISKKKNLTFDIDGDSLNKEGGLSADINEVVVKGKLKKTL